MRRRASVTRACGAVLGETMVPFIERFRESPKCRLVRATQRESAARCSTLNRQELRRVGSVLVFWPAMRARAESVSLQLAFER